MANSPVSLKGKKILITGATGFVAQPIVRALAVDSEVFAGARFKNPADKLAIEAAGAKPVVLDLAADNFDALPDVDFVINLAVAKSGKWSTDLSINAEGAGRLMARYKDVEGFLHFSSTGVYEYAGHELLTESSDLGDNHRNLFKTYSISKIAAETVVRFVAKQYNIPTTIARLNVPYGPFPCWPFFHLMMMKNGQAIDVHPDQPNGYSPIHSDDYIAKIPYLLGCAEPDAKTMNLAGDETVSIEQWCGYLSELTGLPAEFNLTEKALGNLSVSNAQLADLSGPCQVKWQDGLQTMLATMAPDLLKAKA
jgi:nucleoside-diphosphate-sugar epimerase